jgi:hypothetical protein
MKLEYQNGWYKLTSPHGRVSYMQSFEEALAYCVQYYNLFVRPIN